jgi:hypothetical protein
MVVNNRKWRDAILHRCIEIIVEPNFLAIDNSAL